MNHPNFVPAILLLMQLTAPVLLQAQPVPKPGLEPFGLQGKSVTSLGIYGRMYAGTKGQGVFRIALDSEDTTWTSLGLEGRDIRSIYPHKYGPLGFAVTAGIAPSRRGDDTSLVYCSTFDQPNWAATDSGMDRNTVQMILSLDGFPDPTICGETFAAGGGRIWRRGFLGNHWESVLDIGIGVANVVRADLNSGVVWAGGETGIFAPWIAKSKDQGETWEVSYPDLSGDNACDALAVHPFSSDTVYAGMEGTVLRTAEGGKSWQRTGLRDTPVYFYGLAIDPAVPTHIYAGGTIANPNSWALWESFDAGRTWHEIAVPHVAGDAPGISSLAADPDLPGVVYIATFGNGVWRYASPLTRVEAPPAGISPQGYVLEQNSPNPFGGARQTVRETEIRFHLAAAENIKLEIFDLTGRRVRTLAAGARPAGAHTLRWDGTDANGAQVAAGIYLCCLQAGARTVATRRLVVIR